MKFVYALIVAYSLAASAVAYFTGTGREGPGSITYSLVLLFSNILWLSLFANAARAAGGVGAGSSPGRPERVDVVGSMASVAVVVAFSVWGLAYSCGVFL